MEGRREENISQITVYWIIIIVWPIYIYLIAFTVTCVFDCAIDLLQTIVPSIAYFVMFLTFLINLIRCYLMKFPS